jgi:membrane glycosyltransferase
VFAVNEIPASAINRRRLSFLLSILLLFGLGVVLMIQLLGSNGWTGLDFAILILFAILFLQVAFGCVLSLTGYWVLRSGGDPFRITRTLGPDSGSRPLPNTAIVVPIYNEEVGRVFQGIRAMYDSLATTSRADAFDFFILSDSNDPNHWIEEERTWLELCKAVNGFGRIFYRKRRVTLNHKSGNIADFCRRWGARYRYMIVLDADSIVLGPTFVRLVELMEKNRSVGLIQTVPQLVLGTTLFSRIQQFATRIYGPLFSAGANFWHLGGGSYWGHNAIIRLRPFMEYCALPELPKFGALGGRILSHDTVEAAFLRKAGYGVWTAYDLEGSYEEGPPDLIASLKRDRRWCQGNLQHILVLFSRGLKKTSRIHILTGIMAYVSSPLWLLFLLTGTWMAIRESHFGAIQSASSSSFAGRGALLFAFVMVLLFAPKVLGLVRVFENRKLLLALGGRLMILSSVIAEAFFSMILAPILMLSYTKFVFAACTGMKVKWTQQNRRADQGASWRELLSVHGFQTGLALLWLALIGWQAPSYLFWMAPVFFGLLVAIPFSGLTGSVRLGQKAKAKGLFLIPEETAPPLDSDLEGPFLAARNPFFLQPAYASDYGLLQATLDPYVHAVHVSLLRQRDQPPDKVKEHSEELSRKLLTQGPSALSPEEKIALLWNADALIGIHKELWISPTDRLHDWWLQALRNYNESVAILVRRSVT